MDPTNDADMVLIETMDGKTIRCPVEKYMWLVPDGEHIWFKIDAWNGVTYYPLHSVNKIMFWNSKSKREEVENNGS